MQIKFGTDGVRGVYGHHPCTVAVAKRFGATLVRFALEMGDAERKVCIGNDTRPSHQALVKALTQGVIEAGGRATLLGVLPTSGVSVAVQQGLGSVGVMVTASHNPSQDNGFKVFGRGGRKLTDDENFVFENWLNDTILVAKNYGDAHESSTLARKHYLSALDSLLSDTPGSLRVGFDLANGAATSSRDWITKRLGANAMFYQGASTVINDCCGSEYPQHLAKFVTENKLDAGVALDGDADRALLIDHTGQIVPGDALAWLLTRGLNYTQLAVTVMSNGALEQNLPSVRVVRTKVGDRHLAKAMREQNIPLGCEESGHVLFSDGLPTGDGLLTAWRALCIAEECGGLAHALRAFTLLPRKTAAVVVGARPPLDEIPGLMDAQTQLLPSLGKGGRIFLRYSGTQSRLRVLVEGDQINAVVSVSQRLVAIIERAIGVR